MPDLTPFEQRLAGRLAADLTRSARSWNASRIARDAMATRRPLDRVLQWLGLGRAIGSPAAAQMRLIALAGLLLVGVAAAAIVAGMLLQGPRLPADPRLAYVLPNSDLVLANADGTGAVVVGSVAVPGDAFGLARIDWAPDGAHLALSGSGPFAELAIIDADGRERHRRAIHGSSEVEWSPDGRWLAILHGRIAGGGGASPVDTRLLVLASDGTEEWAVPLPPSFGYDPDLRNLAWAPDGKRIALTGASFRGETTRAFLWLADLDRRTLTQVTNEQGSIDYGPAWLPDGALLVGRHGTLDAGIWRFDLESGGRELLRRLPDAWCPLDCVPYSVSGLTPSPDGKRVAYFDPIENLSVLELDGDEPRRMQLGSYAAITPIAWSDDGRELLFIRTVRVVEGESLPDDLVALDVDSGTLRVVAGDVLSFDWLSRP